MGVKDLRDAFNDAAAGAYICSLATLGYQRAHDTEWQILKFSGTAKNGAPFAVQSDPLRPGTKVNEAARKVALDLVAKEIPK